MGALFTPRGYRPGSAGPARCSAGGHGRGRLPTWSRWELWARYCQCFGKSPRAQRGVESTSSFALPVRAKLGRKQRDIFNPHGVSECSVQPTGGTGEKMRRHLLELTAKSLRRNQKYFNISEETREITTGLKELPKLPKKNAVIPGTGRRRKDTQDH